MHENPSPRLTEWIAQRPADLTYFKPIRFHSRGGGVSYEVNRDEEFADWRREYQFRKLEERQSQIQKESLDWTRAERAERFGREIFEEVNPPGGPQNAVWDYERLWFLTEIYKDFKRILRFRVDWVFNLYPGVDVSYWNDKGSQRFYYPDGMIRIEWENLTGFMEHRRARRARIEERKVRAAENKLKRSGRTGNPVGRPRKESVAKSTLRWRKFYARKLEATQDRSDTASLQNLPSTVPPTTCEANSLSTARTTF